MKRGLLIFLLLLVCAATAGCTFYFGGWGTSSGQVLKVVPGGADTPAPGVQITYASASDPDLVVWHGVTDKTGRWTTSWLKIDRYTATFVLEGYATSVVDVDVRDKGADTPVGQVLLVPKKSDK